MSDTSANHSRGRVWLLLWTIAAMSLVFVGLKTNPEPRRVQLQSDMHNFALHYDLSILFYVSILIVLQVMLIFMSNSAVANIERLRNLSFIHLFAYLLQRSHITPEYLNIKNAIYISPLHGITQILTQLPIFTILHNIQFKSQSNQSIKIILTKLLVLGTCITAQIHIFALHDPEAQESTRLISIASIVILRLVVLFRTRSLSTFDAIKLESVAIAWTARYIYLLSGVFGYQFIEFVTIYADISIVALFFGYLMVSIVTQEAFQKLAPKNKEEYSTIENLWIYLKIHNLDSLKQEVPPVMLESSLLLVETELDIVFARSTSNIQKTRMQMKGTMLLSCKGHKADAVDLALDMLHVLKTVQLPCGHRFQASCYVHRKQEAAFMAKPQSKEMSKIEISVRWPNDKDTSSKSYCLFHQE